MGMEQKQTVKNGDGTCQEERPWDVTRGGQGGLRVSDIWRKIWRNDEREASGKQKRALWVEGTAAADVSRRWAQGVWGAAKREGWSTPWVAAVMAGAGGRVSSGSGMASQGTRRLLALTQGEVRSRDRALGRRFGSKQPLGRNQPHHYVANGLERGQGANSEMRPLQKSKSCDHSSRGREVVGFWIHPLNTLNHIGKTT